MIDTYKMEIGHWEVKMVHEDGARVSLTLTSDMVHTGFVLVMSSKEAKDLAALLTQTGENHDSDTI